MGQSVSVEQQQQQQPVANTPPPSAHAEPSKVLSIAVTSLTSPTGVSPSSAASVASVASAASGASVASGSQAVNQAARQALPQALPSPAEAPQGSESRNYHGPTSALFDERRCSESQPSNSRARLGPSPTPDEEEQARLVLYARAAKQRASSPQRLTRIRIPGTAFSLTPAWQDI